MGINNINITNGVVWSKSPESKAEKITDFSSSAKPANADQFVLQLPVSETIYKKHEFVTDKSMAENIACCYTYMERTLTFADGSTISGSSYSSCFAINLDTSRRDFSKSGADMYGLASGTEETWTRIDRSYAESAVSGSISANGFTGAYAEKSSLYKETVTSETRGSAAYKNGAVLKYTENASASLELYNKCAVMLAGSFGEKADDLVLNENEFNELFGVNEAKGQRSAEKLREQLEMAAEKRKLLKDFMDRHINRIRKKHPDNESLKTFGDTYSKLMGYSYMNLSSLAEKIFSFEK